MNHAQTHTSQPLARSLLWLVALALLASAWEASAGNINWGKQESPRMYGQYAAHRQLVGPVDTHFIGSPPASCWASPTYLIGGFGPPETITAVHRARHLVPVCPGETAPAPWWTPPPISPPAVNWGTTFAGARGSVIHPGPPNHADNFLEVLGAAYRWGILGGYAYASIGFHDPICESRWCTLTGDQVVPPVPDPPPDTLPRLCISAAAVDSHLGVFALVIVAQNIEPADLLGAEIHIGAVGENGPGIYWLGSGLEWENLNGDGLAKVVLEEPFPMEFYPAFVAEQMYISLYTMEYPEGALRGQLLALPVAYIAGDVNCDGEVSFADINPFVLYLSNFDTWQSEYPDCPPENGDINGDGEFPSFRDINAFVSLLSQ